MRLLSGVREVFCRGTRVGRFFARLLPSPSNFSHRQQGSGQGSEPRCDWHHKRRSRVAVVWSDEIIPQVLAWCDQTWSCRFERVAWPSCRSSPLEAARSLLPCRPSRPHVICQPSYCSTMREWELGPHRCFRSVRVWRVQLPGSFTFFCQCTSYALSLRGRFGLTLALGGLELERRSSN